MIQQHNIDRNDAQYNTKAPFSYECELALPGGTLPSLAFRSIVVYCDNGTVPPVRMTAVQVPATARDHVTAVFGDAAGRTLGHADLYMSLASEYVTTFIYSNDGVLKGHVCYNAAAAELLRDAAAVSGGSYATSDVDFVLLPQCHVAWLYGHCRAISVNGHVTLHDVHINPTIEMHTAMIAAAANRELASVSYTLGMAEPYVAPTSFKDSDVFNGICKMTLNNLDSVDLVHVSTPEMHLTDPLWLGGVNLTIRSSDTSNIRVILGDRSTKLDGVTND